MPKKTKSESVPAAMAARYDDIAASIDAFCAEHLNDEYAQVCRQMAATLARKRPSPLLGGKANTWAAAILHTVGSVNFLFDKSQSPHMRADDLAVAFGLSKSTVGNKSKQIKDILKIGIFDPAWTLPSRMDSNPMAWMISVDGFIIDARSAPRYIQEVAYHKGLIPYLPGEEE
ncbi:MAG: hypothetical protein JW850_03460 [Thermoflexales bacterium]|nr:hypothetical protein [Thermoflexales bacterium]